MNLIQGVCGYQQEIFHVCLLSDSCLICMKVVICFGDGRDGLQGHCANGEERQGQSLKKSNRAKLSSPPNACPLQLTPFSIVSLSLERTSFLLPKVGSGRGTLCGGLLQTQNELTLRYTGTQHTMSAIVPTVPAWRRYRRELCPHCVCPVLCECVFVLDRMNSFSHSLRLGEKNRAI